MKIGPAFLAALAVCELTLNATTATADYTVVNLALTLTCPLKPSNDPTFLFTLTNRGSTPVSIEGTTIPVNVTINLTVIDANGKVVEPGMYMSGMRHPSPDRVIEPGRSLVLEDWVDHTQPQTSVIPLHLFGYKLAPGTYEASGRYSHSASDEPQSNICVITII